VCFLVALGLLTPRFILVVLWIFTDYLARAYDSWILPTLGFFLLPTTTIAYAIAKNSFSSPTGTIRAGGAIVIALGALIDLGLLGRGRGVMKDRGRRTA
jgi:4-amino-4-deoxy-L-arabinose transferase-like glycosyltransferase